MYSQGIKEHGEHLRTTLQLLRNNSLYAKHSKCSFAAQCIEYLGHFIAAEGVSTDPEKVRVV